MFHNNHCKWFHVMNRLVISSSQNIEGAAIGSIHHLYSYNSNPLTEQCFNCCLQKRKRHKIQGLKIGVAYFPPLMPCCRSYTQHHSCNHRIKLLQHLQDKSQAIPTSARSDTRMTCRARLLALKILFSLWMHFKQNLTRSRGLRTCQVATTHKMQVLLLSFIREPCSCTDTTTFHGNRSRKAGKTQISRAFSWLEIKTSVKVHPCSPNTFPHHQDPSHHPFR